MDGLTPVLPIGNNDNCYGNGIGAFIGGAVGGAVGNAWNGNRWNNGAMPMVTPNNDANFLMDSITATNTNLGSTGRDILMGIQGLQMANCQGFGGLNTELTRSQARTEAAVYTTGLQGQIEAKNNTIAELNSSHNTEVAMLNGFNTIRAAQQDCCCKTQFGLAELGHTVTSEECKTRTAIHQEGEATRALISALDREKLLRENAALSAKIGSLESQQFTSGVVAASNQALKNDMNQMMNQVVATVGAVNYAYRAGRDNNTTGTGTTPANG